jgi:hypothetical protein
MPSVFPCGKICVVGGVGAGSSAYGGHPDDAAACWWCTSRSSDLRMASTVGGVAVAVILSATMTGGCVTAGGIETAGGAMVDASSEASLSAAAAAARSVLRSDDDVLLLRSSSVVDVWERNRARCPVLRPTDSRSDSTAFFCFGKWELSCRGKASKSCGGVDIQRDSEILDVREAIRVDGIGTASREEEVAVGEVVKGGKLPCGRGNENTADDGRETGRLLRLELGVCEREGAL